VVIATMPRFIPVEIRSREHFFQGWSATMILPISASHVVGITDRHDHTQLLSEMGYHKLFAQAG
jgi:hypothetical protein